MSSTRFRSEKTVHQYGGLQKDLVVSMAYYNNQRTHQGKMCCERIPMETLLEAKPIGADKNLTQI